MPAAEAAKLFKALAPRPLSRAELGCDDPANLRVEITRLVNELRRPDLTEFQPLTPGGGGGGGAPLKVLWRLPSPTEAEGLRRLLASRDTLLQLDLPGLSASGHAALIGYLSMMRMLAKHPALQVGSPSPALLALRLPPL